ncbi:MAG: type II toxin-antitoxin system RelE/ParE family toxin [Candidatus Aenigmarchaeota archaeon]|nr:type II toxin-antitoxin system RelE/ParE family toxin [Candidatus Aenigmarchaeota archaeon]
MYSIIFSLSAKKQLQSLDKHIQKRIISVLERIRFRPERFVRKLVGDPAYRLRVGDYRVIMDIEKDRLLIIVLKVGHRKRIYK